jgi:uncharacterized protein YyaL (SSP411 family)
MANALADETSPYLLQHRENPVDWLAWGERALTRAREEDRPLLVSIGYSSCHWCHVMERESFEDEEIALIMNRDFVCVKVDREERPDVDAIYMEAVQSMTGHGGWPLNVFLTPEQTPIFGGTYFPPEPHSGMPSWLQVLEAVAAAWRARREDVRAGGQRAREQLAASARLRPSSQPIQPASLDAAVAALAGIYDQRHGGFGSAPKFPPSCTLEFLLRRAAARPAGADGSEGAMALGTLRAMAAGGIHDQIGGGFSRYAVDGSWTVPHFEKMLYDNALLARAYLHGWLLNADTDLRDVCLDTLGWTLREMRGPEGGFYSGLDADSEGVEGRYYVWTIEELRRLLGPDADAAIAYFGASERGNFEGVNVLQAHGPRPDAAQLARIKAALLAARSLRVRPALDDKRLTSWNALMITALAEAGAALGARPAPELDPGLATALLDGARECARFLLDSLRDEHGRLLRTYNQGQARLPGYLEDHAFLLEALLTLYEASFEEEWFSAALELAGVLIERFADPVNGGFFSTANDHEQLLARRKELDDAPIPSGSSSAAFGLLRLAALTGEQSYQRHAVEALRLGHEIAPRHPSAFGHLLCAIDFYVSPTREVALVGRGREALEAVLRRTLRPHVVAAGGPGDGTATAVALLEGRSPIDGRAAAYVCEHFACQRPVSEPEELQALLS